LEVIRLQNGNAEKYLSPRIKSNSGFTLIEIIVVLTIIGIIMGMTVPAMRNFLQRQQLSSQSQDFFTAVNLARSDAIRRGKRVTICQSPDSATCTVLGNWDQGWIVFADPNNNATVDAGEELILVHQALSGGSRMSSDDAAVKTHITFNNLGAPSGIGGTITLCNPQRRIDIILSSTGRLRTTEGTACP